MKTTTTENKTGYICPEWAHTHWKLASLMCLKCNDGLYALVCNETQVTVFTGTHQECVDFRNNH